MQSRVKVMQLSAELADYLIENGIRAVDIHLELEPDHFTITVSGRSDTPPDSLERFATALRERRQPEMDDYYDNLIGCCYRDEGYHMLGALVDASDVTWESGRLTIRVRQDGHFIY